MSAPHGAYILSQLGESLAHCTDCSHSPRPLHHPTAFCQLVATMIDCSGTPPSAYLELHGWGVVLLTGFRVIVAVLCEPCAAAARHARLVAMRILHAFGKLHHDHASELDAARRGEVEASLHAYTFHSATAALHAEEQLTLELFRPFVHSVMRPLLLERSPASSWLSPLLEVGCVLRALLLFPSRHVEEEQILLDAQPPRPRALTHTAGPHTPAVWRELLAMARRVVHAHAGLPHALADAPAAAAAFPSVALCDGCLHLVVLPVHTAPAGACLAAFYHAPCGGARRPTRRRGGARLLARRGAAAHGVDGDGALPVVGSPAELRSALATSARAIAAAFPHSAAEMRALLASAHPSAAAAAGAKPLQDACTGPLGLSAEAAATTAPTAPYGAEVELPPPATPTKSPACEALPLPRETASPLMLEIQTPRVQAERPVAERPTVGASSAGHAEDVERRDHAREQNSWGDEFHIRSLSLTTEDETHRSGDAVYKDGGAAARSTRSLRSSSQRKPALRTRLIAWFRQHPPDGQLTPTKNQQGFHGSPTENGLMYKSRNSDVS